MAEKGGSYLKVYCFSVLYQKFYGKKDKKSWKQFLFHETFVDPEMFRLAHVTQLIPGFGFLTFTYFFVPLYGSEVWISVLKNFIISKVGILTCLHSWTNPWVLLVLITNISLVWLTLSENSTKTDVPHLAKLFLKMFLTIFIIGRISICWIIFRTLAKQRSHKKSSVWHSSHRLVSRSLFQ